MTDTPRSLRPTRHLPTRTRIVLACVLLAAALMLAMAALTKRPPPRRTAAATPPEGAFTPSREQWRALTLAPAPELVFHDTVQAEGKIAVDEDHATPVFSPFSGRVTAIRAQAGDVIRQGAPLFEIDALEFVQGRNDLQVAAAALTSARAQLKLAEETEARQSELYRTAGGALKDWRQAQIDRTAAQSLEQGAETALASARGRLSILGVTPQRLRALENAAGSPLARAQARVDAPISGVVMKRNLAEGQYITAGGDTPLFLVGDPSQVWVTAQVRETDAPKVRLGATLEVTTPAYPDRTFAAKVTYVAATLDPDTHRLLVRAVLPNPDRVLKPEMFARVAILSGPGVRGVGAPQDAIIREGDTARLWVAGSDGALRLRQIHTGLRQGEMVQVTDGLAPGERVVTRGALFIDRAGRPE